jgi:hypothetical protein
MHSYASETTVTAKILQNPGGQCTTVLADICKKQAFSIIFAPPKLHQRDATEPNTRLNVYLAEAPPSDSSRIVRGQPEQTVAWPKHGNASCNSCSHGTGNPSHGTHLHAQHLTLQSCQIYYMSRDHPNELMNHILHPSPAPGLLSPGAPEKTLRMRC